MNRKLLKTVLMLSILTSTTLLIISSLALCEGVSVNDTELTHKISTEGLSPFNKWWVDMYNDERIVYSLCVIGIMMCLGITLGFITDFIMRMFGFKTTKIVHHE